MTCQKCYEDGECEYPTTFGCYYRDYDCEHGCDECHETDECKYESGELGALVYTFNCLVEEGKCTYHPLMGRHIDEY
jgi:hypothetical protein